MVRWCEYSVGLCFPSRCGSTELFQTESTGFTCCCNYKSHDGVDSVCGSVALEREDLEAWPW